MGHRQLISSAVCLSIMLGFCVGVDILFSNQTLADGETLISPNQMFELGFFSPNKSTNRFLGIWYKRTPKVVVWVANREDPILGSEGVLSLSKSGALVLRSAQIAVVWFSNSSIAESSAALKLLDTGNLVLLDNSSNIWQSFDYPSDTRLPGMKMVKNADPRLDKHLTSWKGPDDPSAGDFVYRIEDHGLSGTTIFVGTEKRFRSGPWNGLQFTGLPEAHDVPSLDTVFKNGRLVSLSYPFNNSYFTRITIDYAGFLQTNIMNEQKDRWTTVNYFPNDSCDNYGWCGANSICRTDKQPPCECLRGFMAKSQKQWSEFTWTSGCTRTLPQDCREKDGFYEVEGIKYPDPLKFRLEPSMSIDECRSECLNNCSCTAFAVPYLINERNGCLMWFGDLIDVKQFSQGVITGPSIHIRAPISELEQVKDGSMSKRHANLALIAAAASFGMLVVGLSFGCIIFRFRHKRQGHKGESEDFELPMFDLATITAATTNFSDGNVIGKGGFGPVYMGNLSAEQVVAVKRMSRTSVQGPNEFKNEVTLIAKLQHRNLVRILGCCVEGEEKMLIYEYMQNKSLDYFIFDQSKNALLTWPMRFDIIMGIARGLLYLHHDSRLKVIHRDLKTSNVLLDENLNAKISDFGLARMFEADQTMADTERVVGTFGYMAPEYAIDGKFSMKSDVFSMGVVILEIVSGKRNRGFKQTSCYQNLLEQAWLFWKENRALELMDPCYNNSCVESQVKRCIQVGLLCVQRVADDRPLMPAVVLMLSSDDSMLPDPRKPGFFLHHCSSTFLPLNASGNHNEWRSGSISKSELGGR